MFGRRLLCLWGQFVGTYSALAYAAYAGWRERERPVRCGCAAEVRVGGALHRHALCMPMPLPAEHRDFVSEHDDLDGQRCRGR